MKKIIAIIFMILLSTPLSADNLSDSNKLFDFAEDNFPQFFSPSGMETFKLDVYLVRYYPDTNTYIGTRGNDIYVHGKFFGDGILYVGVISDFVDVSESSGNCLTVDASQREGLQATMRLTLTLDSGEMVLTSIINNHIVTDTFHDFTLTTVTNDGEADTNFQVNYHINDGFAYLDTQESNSSFSSPETNTTISTSSLTTYDSPGQKHHPLSYCEGLSWDTGPVNFTVTSFLNSVPTGTFTQVEDRFETIESVNDVTTTPAGTFNTIRIKTLNRIDGLEYTTWYATDYGGMLVKSQATNQITELIMLE